MRHVARTAVMMGIAWLVAAGCATTGRDLLARGIYAKQVVDARKVNITHVRVNTDDDKLIVKGQIRRKPAAVGLVPRFIKVDLLDADGRILDSRKVPYSPKISGRRQRYRVARFTAEFPTVPEPGTVIQIANID